MAAEVLRSQHVDVSHVGDRAVLYNRHSREALVLNPSGSWLWEQLKGGQTRTQLALALQQRYSIPADQADRDVEQFLSDLRQHDAVVAL